MSIETPNRRHFLATSSVAAAVMSFPTVLRAQEAQNSKVLKIGLIGCGGRGTGAASQALSADPNVQLWAIGDVFAPQITSALNHHATPNAMPTCRDRSAIRARARRIDHLRGRSDDRHDLGLDRRDDHQEPGG